MNKKLLFALLLGLVAFAGKALARESIEQKKIDYLVHVIADLKGAHFIRNGVSYDAAKAAEHLLHKLKFAGDRIGTAEQFIAEVGTGSSLSGKKYLIELEDGRTVESAEFLRRKLAEYPQAASAKAGPPRPKGGS